MSFMSFQVDEEPEQPTTEKAELQPTHTIEEVLADVQGQYDFLQDSVIDMNSEYSFSCYNGLTYFSLRFFDWLMT